MKDIDTAQLRRIDLTLLCVFVELMRHRRLTIVATRLGLTQSAISHSLKRLRDIFGDPLFRRRPNGVEPTARALALEPRISSIVALTREALRLDSKFDPGTADRLLRIAALDYESSVMAGPLTDLLRSKAPHMRLSLRSTARREALDLLTEARLDAAIGYFPHLPDSFTSDLLYMESYAVVARRGHRVARKRLDMAQYLACQHVLVSIGGDFRGIVDRILSQRGLARDVVATLPMFLPALATVSDTDLVATVPKRLAERHAKHFGLVVLKPPLAIRDFSVSTVIHKRMTDDQATTWLRRQLMELFADKAT